MPSADSQTCAEVNTRAREREGGEGGRREGGREREGGRREEGGREGQRGREEC